MSAVSDISMGDAIATILRKLYGVFALKEQKKNTLFWGRGGGVG